MQARAGAIDELLASGALENHVGGNQDWIQSELDRLGANNEIDSEMARLRGELTTGPGGQAPRQIEANGGAASPAPRQQQAGEDL
jgi:phage shock protein A